jgi:hypothetical protein
VECDDPHKSSEKVKIAPHMKVKRSLKKSPTSLQNSLPKWPHLRSNELGFHESESFSSNPYREGYVISTWRMLKAKNNEFCSQEHKLHASPIKRINNHLCWVPLYVADT